MAEARTPGNSERRPDGEALTRRDGKAPAWPHVVIIGGGFAGLEAAKLLRHEPVRITIIDKQNHHLFQPLLYEVATAALPASDITAPIRKLFRKDDNVEVILDEAQRIDPEAKIITLKGGHVAYDYLILATGSTHTYFGHDEWARFAPGLKTIHDAFEIRRRILVAFEAAERERDPEQQRPWLRFVIVGGGPTGVELAGAISDIARNTLTSDFRHFDPRSAEVILVEAMGSILLTYPPELQQKAIEQLERLGVQVRVNAPVTSIDENGVTLGDTRLEAKTVLWAAGVVGTDIARIPGVPLHRSGRILVNPDLTVPGHPDFFVAGDLAYVKSDDQVVPAAAPGAIQEGQHVARNLRRALRGEPLRPFRYRDKGALATIGRKAAVGIVGKLKLSGLIAWLTWLFVHVLYLVGFRNRVAVLLEWSWSYLTKQRSARVIVETDGSILEGLPPHEEVPRALPERAPLQEEQRPQP